jgi:hypothetical protein
MPFTISHAAAVLPFARPLARWRLLSAAIIGSMVPDFGWFMPWHPPRIDTHSAASLVTFCLPMGLATFWVFQQLLKTPVLAVLPDAAHARWRRFKEPADIGSVKQWLLASLGVVAGAVTHLVWDGFTHEGARGVRMIPALVDPFIDIGGHRVGGARLWQDLSSLIGLAVVLGFAAYGLRPGPPVTDEVRQRRLRPAERHLWIMACGLMTVLLSSLFLIARRPADAGHAIGPGVGNIAIAALRGFAAAWLLVSVCLMVRLRASP